VSDLDIRALESNFESWKHERAPNLKLDKAFERFSTEQVLKDFELSDDEIQSGLIGGGDDGGIDAIYLFINRTLIQDETDVPDPATIVNLELIQSKYATGFDETAIEKMHSFAQDLLDYTKTPESLTYLNSLARDAIQRFRSKYDEVMSSQHTFIIRFTYTTKSDSSPHPKVMQRIENLQKFIRGRMSAADVQVELWSCSKLLAEARRVPKKSLAILISNNFSTADKSVVCLAPLREFAKLLTDDNGNLRRSILEANVRDYAGAKNLVNADIRETLGKSDNAEFWWLNNGITIVATDCSISGDKVVVTEPQIVNGLQTSNEIFSYFKMHSDATDRRNVLVRVIVPPEEAVRNRIIKATNFQTPVNPTTLHATEPLHFDIEERLKLYNLYYDRRPGYYRILRKPINQIISISGLAKAVMAIVLRKPDDARGRFQTALNKDEVYKETFNEQYNRDAYASAISMDRQVVEFLGDQQDSTSDERRDVRYYVDLWVACSLLKAASPTAELLAGIVKTCLKPINVSILQSSYALVLQTYRQIGGTDKVAKGPELRLTLISMLNKAFGATKN